MSSLIKNILVSVLKLRSTTMVINNFKKIPVVTILVKYTRCRICGTIYETLYDHDRSIKLWRRKKEWKAIYVGWCTNC